MIKSIIAYFLGQTYAGKSKPFDHEEILKNSNDARLVLCKLMRDIAKTSEDKAHAEQLLAQTLKDRVLIPIRVAKRHSMGL